MLSGVLFVCALCTINSVTAQNQDAFWYFGANAGIDFNQSPPMAIDDGQIVTLEGCATISSSTGDLLFYTDGSTVYNRNHVLMLNGDNLLGDSSSTSSAIIVPDPGNSDRFYIFTVDTDDQRFSDADGLHYSTVDMALDNGLGGVDAKNISLLDITSEKLTAVRNFDRTGYWVLTHFQDIYYAYELTAAGLSQPVLSQVAPFIELVATPFTNVDVSAMRGYIRMNRQGTQLAAAHFSNNTTAGLSVAVNEQNARSLSFTNAGELYLYDFDSTTGIVSNPQQLMDPQLGGSFYGLEFSASGQYLYAEIDYMLPAVNTTFTYLFGEVVQFDLDAMDIPASRTRLYTDQDPLFRGALQLGKDGRIYHTRLFETALSVIENPDVPGIAANYQHLAFPLAPGTLSEFGLPIFVQGFLDDGVINLTDHCKGEEQNLSFVTGSTVVSVQWNFGDGGTSTELAPSYTWSAAGTYLVQLQITTLTQSFIVAQEVEVFENLTANPVEDLEECDAGFDRAVFDLIPSGELALSNPEQSFLIFESIDEASLGGTPIQNADSYTNITNPQTLFIRVENENCFDIVPLTISTNECGITAFNVITPDGDGVNDTLVFPGLRDVYENFVVHIYNRWGHEVWTGNQQTSDWSGIANTGQVVGDNLLPVGTYFYVVEFNDPDDQDIAGFVYLLN